ncbi:MAG: efflux RND transporter permease subunit [Bacteroidales bacterium]|nr:efflux RND transporter permease subunit [Bacteroidales bacterium]
MENDEKQGKKREFKLTTIALKNKTSVYLLTFVILLFGGISYQNMPKELFPDIAFPYVMVQTTYPGNPPADIENLVTRPLEKEIESVKGIKEMRSTSAQDASMIFIEFSPNIELDKALNDVKDAVDKAKSELPKDLPMDPMVMDIDFTEFPILNINLSGDYSIDELKTYAEKLEEDIETVYEISKVQIQGLPEREVKISVDPYKMESFQVGFGDIEQAIAQENVSMSGGELLVDGMRRTVRVVGEFVDLNEIKNIVVKHENHNIVYLWQLAEVSEDYEEVISITRLFHQPVISLQVIKKGGENLLSATAQVERILKDAVEKGTIPGPDKLKISITNDQSDMVKKQLANLENSMIISMIFVIVVLFFFLGTRNALFVGLAIPLSMFLSFAIMGGMGYKLNMIVLFSLILALGMLVDNAIVVVENIYRFMDQGHSRFKAAKLAVGEIAVPIIASTATTLAAFVPLAFWDSIVGSFMSYLPVTLIIVLTSSLFVALVIIPVFASSFGKTQEGKANLKRGIIISFVFGLLALMVSGDLIIGLNIALISLIITILNHYVLNKVAKWFQNAFLTKMEAGYDRFLRFTLRGINPAIFFGSTIALLFFTLIFFGASNPKVEFFPNNDPTYINVMAELPIGTDVQKTNRFVLQLEKDIDKLMAKEIEAGVIESILVNVGAGAVGEDEQASAGNRPNKGLVTISFVDYDKRQGISSSEIMKMLSDSLSNKYPGVAITTSKNRMGPPTGKAINLEVSGDDYNRLIKYADTISTLIENSEIEGIEGLSMDLQTGQQELIIHIDREKARRFGLSTIQIAGTIRTALYGKEVSNFKKGEDEYPIQLRLSEDIKNNISILMNQKITFRNTRGKLMQVPISSVAEFEYTTTYGSVRRKDMERVITLSSNVIEGFNATEINEKIEELLAKIEFPKDYQDCSYSFSGGQQQDQQESMAFLMNAMLIAVALILLILVSQFNSIVKPFIILASVLFSTIGVFGGLATFNMSFVVVMTGIGIISLAGVVVNNAIVLIDYIDLLKRKRREELGLGENDFLPFDEATECIVQAGKTRLRPVLLTAITTILGLFPMALGMNIDFEGLITNYAPNIYIGGDMAHFWGPLSWTVIFGLSFATFLTLVIVPVMYRIANRSKYHIIRFKENYAGKIA